MNIESRLKSLTADQLQLLLEILGFCPSANAKVPPVSPANPGAGKTLAAYYLCRSREINYSDDSDDSCRIVDGLDDQSLRDYCSNKLPSHMRPAKLIALNRFPTLPNGKISIADLPLPAKTNERQNIVETEHYEDSAVHRLIGILGNILGTGNIRADDNFFEIGGDSITAIQFISKAREAGIQLEFSAVSESDTISEIAAAGVIYESTDKPVSEVVPGRLPQVADNFLESGLNEQELEEFLGSFD